MLFGDKDRAEQVPQALGIFAETPIMSSTSLFAPPYTREHGGLLIAHGNKDSLLKWKRDIYEKNRIFGRHL